MFEVPKGPFTEAEIRAAKEQGIVPGWLRRILESYKRELDNQEFLSTNSVLVPEGYHIISEEEHADMVREAAEPGRFETAGVIGPDVHLEDAYELLVDCE